MLDIIVFNVSHGQSIFVYPQTHPDYGMLIDCGNTEDFNPVDFLLQHALIRGDGYGLPTLSNLTLTNYDHDHFSGLPYLMGKVFVKTITFPQNLSSQDLRSMKPEQTVALDKICYLKDTYTVPATLHRPPYQVVAFSLTRDCFPGGLCDTNNLSQVVFVAYGGSVICISGDVEEHAWAQLLTRPDFQAWLKATKVFVAAHHGRESGYAEEVFSHCSPEVIVLSDKPVVHGTQEGMSQTYANHVAGNGVRLLQPPTLTPRKVLTTRNDGHIWVQFDLMGGRQYRTFVV